MQPVQVSSTGRGFGAAQGGQQDLRVCPRVRMQGRHPSPARLHFFPEFSWEDSTPARQKGLTQHPSLRLKRCVPACSSKRTPCPSPAQPSGSLAHRCMCGIFHAVLGAPMDPGQLTAAAQGHLQAGDPLGRGSCAAQWRLPLKGGTSRGASPDQTTAWCHGGWCMARATTS